MTKNIDLGLLKIKDYLYNRLSERIDKDLIAASRKCSSKSLKIESELINEFYNAIISPEDEDCLFKVNEALLIFYYDGKYYAQIEYDVVLAAIRDCMIKLGIARIFSFNSHKKIMEEVYLGLTTNNHCRLNEDSRYVIFNNVVLNLENGETYEHSQEYATTIRMDFNYDPNAKSDRWNAFINQVLPNPEFKNALQEFTGAMFVDRYKYKIEKACYLLGSGRNGKSVFCDVIKSVLGSSNYSVFEPDALFKGQTIMYSMAAISGKIANICDDASNNDFSGGTYKSFVSGAETEARNPYGKPFKVKKIPLFMLNVNEMPMTKDDSAGYHRRALIVAFEVTIAEDEVDPVLTSKLTEEKVKSAIFNWIMEGRTRFIENNGKFSQYGATKEIQKRIKAESNNAFRWLTSTGFVPASEEDMSKSISAKDLYNMYVDYCNENGEKKYRTSSSLAKILKNEGFIKKRKAEGVIYFYKKLNDYQIELNLEHESEEDLPF